MIKTSGAYLYQPLQETLQATVDRVNVVSIKPHEMVSAIDYSNGTETRRTLVDLSHHLLSNLSYSKAKAEAVLLRTTALWRTLEHGVPGTQWGGDGGCAVLSDAIVAAAATATLLLDGNVIRFEASELLRIGLESSQPEGRA
jgi:hypothetical protein